MKDKYTPGPWKIQNPNPIRYSGILIEPDNKKNMWDSICLCGDNIDNAKLIACAPELLEDHISDIELIKGYIKDLKEGKSKEVIIYALENLLVSKKSIIQKATE